MFSPRGFRTFFQPVLKPCQPAVGILILNQNHVRTAVAVHVDDRRAAIFPIIRS